VIIGSTAGDVTTHGGGSYDFLLFVRYHRVAR